MRTALFAALMVASVATPAIAREASVSQASSAELREGITLRDANQSRLGKITRVYEDGSVQIILGSKFAVVPASTLVTSEAGVSTSLTKAEVRKMN